MMQLGIFAKTFAVQGARDVLLAARNAGYTCVQFNMASVGLPSMPDDIAPDVLAEISSAVTETGVSIAAISATYNMIHPDAAIRKAGMRRLGTIIAAAAALGVPMVTLCTGTRDAADQWRHHPDNGTPGAWRDLLKEMQQAAQLAEDHGVDLGIEPELANVVSSAKTARRMMDELQSPRLKIVLDPANLFETGESRTIIAEAIGLVGSRIAMAHAKDRDATGAFVAAGQGVVDFGLFIGGLKAAGFRGPVITHGLSEAEAPAVAAFLSAILKNGVSQ